MPEKISNLSLYIHKYKEIIKFLDKPIDIQKLPLIAESKIFKFSAEKYGHVIIKLSLETEEDIFKYSIRNYYSYEWSPEPIPLMENALIIPLDKLYEQSIINEIKVFVTLLELLNNNTQYLRFSIIGGSFLTTERPYFAAATAEALIQIIKKLND